MFLKQPDPKVYAFPITMTVMIRNCVYISYLPSLES